MNTPTFIKMRTRGWHWPLALAVLLAATPWLVMNVRDSLDEINVLKTETTTLRRGIAGANESTSRIDALLQGLLVLARQDQTAAGIVNQFGITNAAPLHPPR